MRILVTGAYGFIGSQIVSALRQHGHEVVCAVRDTTVSRGLDDLPIIVCDFERDTDKSDWLPRLVSIDAVVNCAGILRERRGQTFDHIHRDTPTALFEACEECGVRKVVQISALGDAGDTRFIASKHAADAHLQTCDLDWVIFRPSVVYTVSGSYGGTSLLRAMASLPLILLVPGSGQQQLQPIRGEDLARAVVHTLETDDGKHEIIEATGPEPVSFRDYLLGIRRWLGFAAPGLIVPIPLGLIYPLTLLGEWFGRGPLGLTMYRMLQRGNIGGPNAVQRFRQLLKFTPMSLSAAFAQSPSYVQDRWQARLYLLQPLLRVMLALLWIGSGIVGFVTPLRESEVFVIQLGLAADWSMPVVYGASVIDLLLGVLLLLRIKLYLVGSLMLLSVVLYTLVLGMVLPELWLEPFGSLLKNLPLIPAILMMMAMEQVR